MIAPVLSGSPIAARVARPAAETARFDGLVWADQRDAVRRTVLVAIPTNMLLGAICLLVAIEYGRELPGLVWFSASAAINLVRMALCGATLGMPGRLGQRFAALAQRDPELRLASGAALVSGFVWASLPLVCDGFSGPQATLYLVVTCGVTAGAVTHGTAYAAIPIRFIVPPLLAQAGILLLSGGFDQLYLAATILLYLAALTRSARQTETVFRDSTRLKHEATALAEQLADAHARSQGVAAEMGRRAAHDALTGLLNRAGFLGEVACRAAGSRGIGCLMLLDLDGFKSVNDLYGHAVGDRILIEVADRLRATLGEQHLIARLGGDEFSVFHVVGDAGENEARALATRLIDAVAVPFGSLDARTLGVSIGIHLALEVDVGEMLTCADDALYAAKSQGRNRFCLFDADLRQRLELRRHLERELARAVAEGELDVVPQPAGVQPDMAPAKTAAARGGLQAPRAA